MCPPVIDVYTDEKNNSSARHSLSRLKSLGYKHKVYSVEKCQKRNNQLQFANSGGKYHPLISYMGSPYRSQSHTATRHLNGQRAAEPTLSKPARCLSTLGPVQSQSSCFSPWWLPPHSRNACACAWWARNPWVADLTILRTEEDRIFGGREPDPATRNAHYLDNGGAIGCDRVDLHIIRLGLVFVKFGSRINPHQSQKRSL